MTRPRTAAGEKPRGAARGRVAARVASATPKLAKSNFTTELHHVIGLARGLAEAPESPTAATPGDDESAKAPFSTDAEAAKLRLHRALSELKPESALKLCALLLAGRDGREISSVVTTTLGAEANSWFSAHALSTKGAKLAEYLQRGHAIACATDFDIEAPVATWDTTGASSLEERVWLSFGKQLASSDPSEWNCLSVTVGRDARQVTKLYLRRADKAWWSFRRVLDRPSPAIVRRAQLSAARGAPKNVPEASLQNVLSYSVGNECRALRRAFRAIRARLGVELDRAKA